MPSQNPRSVRAWCLYDVANSAFATTVMAAVLPEFFSSVAASGLDPDPERARVLATSLWGRANTVTMLVTALSAPFIGALADRLNRRKQFLALLAFTGAILTAGLVVVGEGDWKLAATLYVLASFAWSASLVNYDGLLPHVAAPDRLDAISAKGFAWGYLGGGILLAVQAVAISKPSLFGLADATQAVRLSFVSVGVWWILFTIPLLRDVKESGEPQSGGGLQALADTARRLVRTFAELRSHRQAFLFLLAFWLYNDGIGTITRMGVIVGAELQIGRSTLIGALLAVQFLGFPFTLGFGALARRIGPKPAIFVGLVGYMALCVFALFLDTARDFWILAVGVSMFQGGTQAMSRSFFASMIPFERSGEFFGFFNLSSKFAGILGTLLLSTVGPMFGSSRYGVLGLVVLFALGAGLLARVKPSEGVRARL